MEADHIRVLGGVKSPEFFCAQTTGGDVPNLWKPSTVIRARCLANVHDFVKPILKSTLIDWIKPNTHLSISVIWVESGDADVRFDMTNGVTWCMLGPDALLQPQSQPTSALGLRKWKNTDEGKEADEEVVWTAQEVNRIARHVWGHVLGLPHAYTTKGDWDTDKVSQLYLDNHLEGTRIYSLNGTDRLKSPSSIMHIDQSKDWSKKPISKSANVLVDPESVDLVTELYQPLPPEVDILEISITEFPDWKAYTPLASNILMMNSKSVFKTNKGQVIQAIMHFELGHNPMHQALSGYIPNIYDPGLMVYMGAVDTGYRINELKARYMCFNSSDNRIQTGREYFGIFRSNNVFGMKNVAAVNESFDHFCTFTTPFKAPPKVQVFIFQFSSHYSDNNKWLRITASVVNTSTTGFTIRLNTFGDNIVDQIDAVWIAHEADDKTIRSGRWDSLNTANCINKNIEFSPPFTVTPRCVFYGFHHLDVPFGDACATARCEAARWDRNGMVMSIETPYAQHRGVGASYIALL